MLVFSLEIKNNNVLGWFHNASVIGSLVTLLLVLLLWAFSSVHFKVFQPGSALFCVSWSWRCVFWHVFFPGQLNQGCFHFSLWMLFPIRRSFLFFGCGENSLSLSLASKVMIRQETHSLFPLCTVSVVDWPGLVAVSRFWDAYVFLRSPLSLSAFMRRGSYFPSLFFSPFSCSSSKNEREDFFKPANAIRFSLFVYTSNGRVCSLLLELLPVLCTSFRWMTCPKVLRNVRNSCFAVVNIGLGLEISLPDLFTVVPCIVGLFLKLRVIFVCYSVVISKILTTCNFFACNWGMSLELLLAVTWSFALFCLLFGSKAESSA